MAKKQDEPRQDAPKAGRAKRRAVAPAAADDAGGPCNEAPAAKRPHGRLRNATWVQAIANTVARKLRKATDVTQDESENHSTSKPVIATKAPRVSRRKRSKGSCPSSAKDTASGGPKHRSAKGKVVIACVNPAKSQEAAFEVGLSTSGMDAEGVCAVVGAVNSEGAWTASLGTEVASICKAVE
ncbi:hypothetical protein HPB52_021188 [Rhipicephalus sanguineus]|uniref:Uncharacterized protein n=1 Tax=Rhipicephalus sanguineus TaxID=34632 RepID=A0A9D4PXX4_RHISA|nr:hypothetical protein HPB52_021188 [Rhipicephalus sanguineus]